MARRVVLTMLALVSALLIVAVVPLGLITAGREQDSFQMATVMSAQALATAADKVFLMPSTPLDLVGVASYELFLRGTLDKAFDVTRQNIAMGWTMITMVEGISRAEGGLEGGRGADVHPRPAYRGECEAGCAENPGGPRN